MREKGGIWTLPALGDQPYPTRRAARIQADSSSQRIIAGATAPREDAANVNQWHWSEMDMAAWSKERLTELLVGIEARALRWRDAPKPRRGAEHARCVAVPMGAASRARHFYSYQVEPMVPHYTLTFFYRVFGL